MKGILPTHAHLAEDEDSFGRRKLFLLRIAANKHKDIFRYGFKDYLMFLSMLEAFFFSYWCLEKMFTMKNDSKMSSFTFEKTLVNIDNQFERGGRMKGK